MTERDLNLGGKSDRREFLLKVSAMTGLVLSLPYSRSLQAQTKPLQTVRLSDRMVAIVGSDSNAVAADIGDGLFMVDGGDAAWSGDLLRSIGEQFDSKPVTTLFNTHWHTEHTGSNQVLGEKGAQIIAHENTAGWLGSKVWVRWSDKTYPPLPKSAQPTKTFYESQIMALGDRSVQCTYLPKAHTDGDACVFFPEENVLVTGGMVSNDGWPVVDWWTGGFTGGILNGFDSLVKIANQDTRIVPGNGPLMSYADLQAQQKMFVTVIDRIHAGLRKALSTDELLATKPTAEYDAQWGDPTQFVTLAFHSTWRHLRDSHDTRLNNIA